MKRSGGAIPVVLVFGLALALRCAYALFLKRHYLFFDAPGDDVVYYQQWADQIASGDWLGRDVFFGMPLYPYFLAVLKKLSFGHAGLVRLAHLVLGSVNAVLVFFVARRIFPARVAYLAAILTATNFILVYYDWLMLPVTLIVFLSLAIASTLLRLDADSGPGRWFALGLLFGMALLADGKFAIVLALTLLHLVVRHRRILPRLAKAVLVPAAAGLLLVLSLVAARNRVVGGDWVLLSAHSGINFFIGNNPEANGVFVNPSFLRPNHYGHEEDPKVVAEQALGRELTPSAVSRYWFRRGLDFVGGSPREYLLLLGRKCALFFTDSDVAHDVDLLLQAPWRRALDVNSYRVIVPLALVGAAAALRGTGGTFVPGAFVASQLLFTLAFFLITRHRATVLPFLIVFEAFGAAWVAGKARSRDYRGALAGALAFVVLYVALQPTSVPPGEIEFLRFSRAGFLHAERGNLKEAEEEYRKALALQPSQPTILYNLGNLCLKERRYPEAAALYERALAVRPYDANTAFNLAFSYEQAGDLPRAERGYRGVLRLQPGSGDARTRLATVLHRQGRLQEAERLLR